MNCCVNCFCDVRLQEQIKSMSNITGNCDFCLSSNVITVDCELLTESFEDIFALYESNASSNIFLHEHLKEFWVGLFNPNLPINNIKLLVYAIGRSSSNYSKDLFESPVNFQSHIVDESAKTLELQWEVFANELKQDNRFFLNENIDLGFIEVNLLRLAKTYYPSTLFYRSRIGNTQIPLDQLGKPPKQFATSGRANPEGIPYLYVSDSIETTIYETRSSLYDRLTVGTFKLNAPLQVISLNKIEELSPFEIKEKGFELEEFINIRPYLLRLQSELSKPIRKQDSALDYLPTQYLCEFIKLKGFDAIEYKSAMHKGGYNLAVFKDENLECVDAMFIDVTELKYDYKEIMPL